MRETRAHGQFAIMSEEVLRPEVVGIVAISALRFLSGIP